MPFTANHTALPIHCPEGYRVEVFRKGTACLRNDVTTSQLDTLLDHPGRVLKDNGKYRVLIVGNWLVKRSTGNIISGVLRHAFGWGRHRRAWMAAHHLRNHGVYVPEPLAYYERKVLGIPSGSAQVYQYLSGCVDVEHFASHLVTGSAATERVPLYLSHLALAINGLESANVYHADLSGKNILTRDGVRFYFVDLDAVELGVNCDRDRRMRNHVQLYDSFCDAMSDALLVPFLKAMLPEDIDIRLWMPEVRKRQEARRLKVEAYWAKHGTPDKINPLRNV